jgi:hypothetical protein
MGTPVAELIQERPAAFRDGGGVHLPVVTGADMVNNVADHRRILDRPG